MESTAPPRASKNGFWTATRLGVTFVALILLVAFGSSSCSQSTNTAKTDSAAPRTGANVSVVRSANAPPPAPASKAAPATTTTTTETAPLSEEVMNAELKSLDGKSFKLADYAGKVVVVNLWATWCGPCRIETPHLVQLNKEHKADGVKMIGLTTESNDPDEEKVRDFVRQQEVDYTIGYAPGAFAKEMSRGRNAIPQSFVITRGGRLLRHFIGFNPEITPAKLREAIEQAVNDKSGV